MFERRPFTIIGIIAVCAAVFLLRSTEDAAQAVAVDYGAVPKLISDAWLQLIGGQVNLPVLGQLSRLLTALVVHGNFEHCLYNMVFLWTFGVLASEHLGPWWALVVFVVTGVCGNVAQVLLNLESPIPIVGA